MSVLSRCVDDVCVCVCAVKLVGCVCNDLRGWCAENVGGLCVHAVKLFR